MGTLGPTAKRENVERSFQAFCLEHLKPVAPVDLGDPKLATAKLPEWFAVSLVGPVRSDGGDGRYVNATERAQEVTYLPQVSIFVRSRETSLGHRLPQLRDLVAALLPKQGLIPMFDYAGAKAPLGALIIRRIALDRVIPAPQQGTDDVRQHAYSVEAGWIERFTP